MTRRQEIAKGFKELGFNPVPIGNKSNGKAPIRDDHGTPITDKEILSYSFEKIGVSTGIVSGGLEVLDFDLKNAEDPDKIWEEYKKKVPKTLFDKLVIQTTVSGGYHLIYRCEVIESSKHLANNLEGLAVIETRGEGGLIKCYPSEGYKLIQGNFRTVPILSVEERLTLWVAARLLNKTIIQEAAKRMRVEDRESMSKFPSYNGDLNKGVELLEEAGWTKCSEDEDWINFTRPGKSEGISGSYHKDGLFFYVFTSSQSNFEIKRPYNNHAIYAELQCEGRYDIAYAKLVESGFKVKEGEEEKEYEDPEDFLSDEVEENAYLDQVRKNEVQQGLSTGWPCMDDYYRFKANSVNVGLGFDNVGKSVLIANLMVASKVMHGWKWGIAAPENKTAVTRQRLIEVEVGRPLKTFVDSPDTFNMYKKDSRDHFKIIANKKHYSIEQVLEKGKILYKKYGINAFLIDPYNFFAVEGNGFSNDNNILSKIRVFAEKYCSVYIMAHTYTGTTRNNLDEFGYLKAPTKYDIQGGNNFANRVDDFFIIHRITNHSDDGVRRTMQFIMNKVKEVETGGKIHAKDDFTALTWEERKGFLGYWDDNGNNPMYNFLKNKSKVRELMKSGKSEIKPATPEEAF